MKRKTGWSCPPGEDRQLRLDDLDPDDDEQQGADDQDDELEQSLQDGVGEAVFALQDLPQRVQQHGQRELRAATERAGQYHTARLYLTSDLGSDQFDHLRTFLRTPCATNTSWTQQMPTTVIPCSLHNVAAATRTTVSAMGVHTGKQNRFVHIRPVIQSLLLCGKKMLQ